jgi:hypothetical protein
MKQLPWYEHWPPKCRGCGYDLRGSPTPVCPECGDEYDTGACLTCGGTGYIRIILPIWLGFIGLGISYLLYRWLGGSTKSRDIMTYVLPAIASIGVIIARLTGGFRFRCKSCFGRGRKLPPEF